MEQVMNWDLKYEIYELDLLLIIGLISFVIVSWLIYKVVSHRKYIRQHSGVKKYLASEVDNIDLLDTKLI